MGKDLPGLLLILALATWRTLDWSLEIVPGMGEPLVALPTLRLDPATAPWSQLALFPGVGWGRAQRIARDRGRLGEWVRPAALSLLPGVGATTSAEIGAWARSLEEP